jgi:hypothetical protein
MCEIMHGEKYSEALKTIPLSIKTVMRRIESKSEDIKEEPLTRNKCSPKFSLQINESTDVATCICQIMFRRKHLGRVHVLFTAFREMYRE